MRLTILIRFFGGRNNRKLPDEVEATGWIGSGVLGNSVGMMDVLSRVRSLDF